LPTRTCAFCQIRTLHVISPRLIGSRRRFVNSTIERSPDEAPIAG
jgi:hypothetical protein